MLTLAIRNTPAAYRTGLRGLAELTDKARTCGLDVTLHLTTHPRSPGAVQETTAYRIVQEALTNAARYAPGAPVQVQVDQTATSTVLQVVNGPPAQPDPPPLGSGWGLRGMRERATACGGTLTAAPDPHGGYTVRAVLPHGRPADLDQQPRQRPARPRPGQ